MKGIYLPDPWLGCVGYKTWNYQQERWYMHIVYPNKKRTNVSYARFLMSTHLKRFLTNEEHVDHIDGNKTNDAIENLQILSCVENNRKKVIERNESSIPIKLTCPVCNKEFQRSPRNVNHKVANGKVPSCSRQCGAIFGSHKKIIQNSI